MSSALRIALGADHGGFDLKERIKDHLVSRGHAVRDCGTHGREPVDYPPIAVEVASLVASGECRFGVMVDGRLARYDRGDWAWQEMFLCGYVEFGYRYRWVDLNLGWGFDPIVFDPVINDYQDIGRSETLRQSLAGGVRRGDGAKTGEEIRSLERRLESDGTIKLECIIRF